MKAGLKRLIYSTHCFLSFLVNSVKDGVMSECFQAEVAKSKWNKKELIHHST